MNVAVCDVCGHVWIPSVESPTLCASKKCRSTLWDKGGLDGRTREARSKKVTRSEHHRVSQTKGELDGAH
jgi:hypothetical protein